jgi:hypothetical protein
MTRIEIFHEARIERSGQGRYILSTWEADANGWRMTSEREYLTYAAASVACERWLVTGVIS